jgi:hypothetical protein
MIAQHIPSQVLVAKHSALMPSLRARNQALCQRTFTLAFPTRPTFRPELILLFQKKGIVRLHPEIKTDLPLKNFGNITEMKISLMKN